jgi:Protein of unknown function (DUF1702)
VRRLLRPILLPLLRRDPGEVEEQARHFSIEGEAGRQLVAGVGRAFLGGYHAMLAAKSLEVVSAAGPSVEPHFRPFFFEGAAMGYLPRAAYTKGAGSPRAEADLLGMDPGFRYLYYVGLGFWFGFRHPRAPAALESLAAHLDPFYVPLCYDGFGFKTGFFDFPTRPEARRVLDKAPANRRAPIYQGFGRALFFVCMDDDGRFQRAKLEAPSEHRHDMESGRSLAVAFTGLARPEGILRHLASAEDGDELGWRLLGVTWALTAREMNDPDYFERCLAGLPPGQRELLRLFPRRCREALERASSYEQWRSLTKDAVAADYTASEEVARR